MTGQKVSFSVFTKMWGDKSIEELGEFVRGLGFDGIELPVRPSYPVEPDSVATMLPAAARKLEAVDVLHDFSVPVFRLKQDAIPGRVITGWFEPNLEGEFDVQCAEICGIGHGLMAARVFITSPEKHAAWMASESPLALAANIPSQGIGEE